MFYTQAPRSLRAEHEVRIGDHATNIFEHVIYAVRGENLRHAELFRSQ